MTPAKLTNIFRIMAYTLALNILSFFLPRLASAASNIDITGKAKSELSGYYFDFTGYNSNVKVNSETGKFSGYVFSEDLGWVDFGTVDNTDGPVFVDITTGYLKGKARVLNAGSVIDFGANNGTVRVEGTTFTGYVFSPDFGWINFADTGVSAASGFLEIPTASWGFNEGYGQTPQDSSGYSHTGTLGATTSSESDDPAWTEESRCYAGKCLSFDGGDYVGVSAVVTDVQTVSLWLRPKTTTESIIDLDGGSHKIAAASGVITATGFDNLYVNGQASKTLTANTWQHIVATTSTPFDTASTTIGKVSSAYLTGFVDEVRLFGTAKSSSQVKGLYTAKESPQEVSSQFGPGYDWMSNGLVGYWKMDEASGNATDSSGNSVTLTDPSTVSRAAGKFGNSADLVPASTDYFSTATDINNIQTISFWVYPDSVTTNYFISFSDSVYISIASGVLAANGFAGSFYVNGVTSTTLAVSTWQLVTFTTTAFNAADTYVGRIGTTANYMDGKIDEIRVYQRALSSAEIASLYNWAPGPVGYWKLDENTGTAAYDTSGNSLHGNVVGGQKWVPAKLGSGLRFNGISDQEIDITDNSLLDSDSGTSLTLSTWVRHIGTSASNNPSMIVDKQNADTTAAGYSLKWGAIGDAGTTDGKYRFQIADGVDEYIIDANSATTDTLWHHVAVVFDRSSESNSLIYIDGVAQAVTRTGTFANIGDASNTSRVCIGSRASSTVCMVDTLGVLNGIIDDFRFYNYARTPAQIIEDMNAGHPAPGSPIGSSVAHWKFDEGYGTAFNNSGNLGSTANATASASTWSNAGKYGKAINLNGTSAYASSPKLALITATGSTYNSLSWGGWVNPNTSPASKTILTKDTEFRITTDASSKANCAIYSTSWQTAAVSHIILPLPSWSHVFCTYDGANIKTYINGVLTGNTPQTGNITSTNTTGVNLGWNGSGGQYFGGFLDDFKIYSFALTADQVKVEYNHSSGAVWGAVSTDISGAFSGYAFSEDHGWVDFGTTDNPLGPVAMNPSTGAVTGKAEVLNTNAVIDFTNYASNVSVSLTTGNFSGYAFSVDLGWIAFGTADNSLGPVNVSLSTGVVTGKAKVLNTGAYIDFTNYASNARANLGSVLASWSDSRSYCPPGNIEGNCAAGLNPAPVGEWKMDENTGGYAYDTSGNGNDANLSSLTDIYWASSKFGSGLKTNPDSAFGTATVTDPASGILDFGNQDFTFSLWYKYEAAGGGDYLVLLQKGGTSNTRAGYDFEIRSSTNTAQCKYTDGLGAFTDSASYTSTTLLDGQWHYVSCVMNRASGYYMYLDGTQVGTPDTSLNTPGAGTYNKDLTFGEYGASYYYGVVMDDIKIYNYARTPAQIAWDYNRGDPQGWWKFDENSGNIAYDASGNTYNSAAFSGNTAYTTGKYNYGLTFDGDGDYVSVTDTGKPGIDLGTTTDSYTVSAWFKTSTDFSSDATLMAKWNNADSPNNYPYKLYLDSSEHVCFQISDGTLSPSTCGSIARNDNTWHHALGVRDVTNDKLYLYVDGNLVNSYTDTATTTCQNNDSLTIGNSGTSYTQYDFTGLIDDVNVFNYPLNATQIKLVYNNGAVKF